MAKVTKVSYIAKVRARYLKRILIQLIRLIRLIQLIRLIKCIKCIKCIKYIKYDMKSKEFKKSG